MTLRTYLHNRFYLRGTSWLGLVNTALACVSNRVVVRHVKAGRTIGWSLQRGTDFPPSRKRKER